MFRQESSVTNMRWSIVFVDVRTGIGQFGDVFPKSNEWRSADVWLVVRYWRGGIDLFVTSADSSIEDVDNRWPDVLYRHSCKREHQCWRAVLVDSFYLQKRFHNGWIGGMNIWKLFLCFDNFLNQRTHFSIMLTRQKTLWYLVVEKDLVLFRILERDVIVTSLQNLPAR